MSNRPIFKVLAPLLVILVIVPAAFFSAPPQAHAFLPVFVDGSAAPTDIGTWIESTISAVANPTTAASTYWTMLKGSVLDPLAHALAQAVLKQITASIVNSINGTNASPQYVTNLAGNLQKTGDQVGLSFIAQFTKTSNSPFAPAIGSSLQQNYLQQTSLAGFFAANQCTLNNSSPNINSFLAGNYNQGGIGAWFALTTQNQNNPFTLYLAANSQLQSSVGAAQTNQRQTITQNGGFLSWCSSGSEGSGPGIGATCSDFVDSSDCSQILVCIQTPGKTTGTCQAPTAATSNDTAQTCYNNNGTPGTVETPGSVIESTLNKSLGSGVDSLVSVHDFDQMIDTILSALATKVVSTGLTALSGGGSNSVTSQLASGSTATDPNAASVASAANTQAQTALTQLTTYTSNWQIIQSAAQTASSSVTQLMNTCTSESNAAQTALLTEVAPVALEAQQAFAAAASTQTLATQVETDASNYTSGAAGAAGALTADTQALAAAPPSAADIAASQSQSQSTAAATSSSSISLLVSGGTLVDQMKLLTTNAQNASAFCTAPTTTP